MVLPLRGMESKKTIFMFVPDRWTKLTGRSIARLNASVLSGLKPEELITEGIRVSGRLAFVFERAFGCRIQPA